MLARVDAQGLQRAQVQLLRVAGVGLEDDLELVVHLHAVGVLAVAPIIRADGGLYVGHVPRLRAQHAQGGGGVERAGAHLLVIGLPDEAALLSPEVLQAEDDGLEIESLGHKRLPGIK